MRAKGLLAGKGAEFEEIDLSDDDQTREKLREQTGWMTVPMIFIGEKFIGGADELFALESSGELDTLLGNT